ncbi:SapC family protein [Catenovulum agarivorans]|uniref:SapC family protein n=1 Tax=Catenovulum agarivorans TaxID=1172192 RepID=UPI0003183333|nr:SapC family protein [Catenovulum agarivorans]
MTDKNVQLLDKTVHRTLTIDTSQVDIAENQINMAMVVVNELSTIVHEYPVFIAKNPQTGQFMLGALLGLKSGQNLFIQDGQWQASYLPLEILRRPFQALFDPEKPQEGGRIAIDLNHPQVVKDGQKIFDDKGEATEYLKRIQQTFAALMAGTQQTTEILTQADKLGLIEGINISVDLANGEKAALNGLFAFNQQAVSKLSGDNLELAHTSGILQVCHLVLSSGLHLQKLVKWAG